LRLILIITLFLTLFIRAESQGYPVQVTLNIGTPNSPLLENYYSGINPLFNIRVLYKDFNSTRPLPIRIYFSIENSNGFTISTNQSFTPRPIYINGGESYKIEDSELSQYFSKQAVNATGTGSNLFQRSLRLPEGLYRIKVKVYEYHRNIPISNQAINVIWIRENDPPLQVQPENGSTIIARYPQNITFTWVRRHISAPVGNSEINYIFQLFEQKDLSVSPEIVVRSQRPIFTTDTDFTTLIYNSDNPMLIPGRSYVWRIRVVDNENYLLFKNNGYSQPKSFTFGQECRKPYNISTRDVRNSNTTVEWQNDDVDQESELRVREIGDDVSDWYTYNSSEGSVLINQLSADRTYEIQIRNICDNGIYSDWTYPLSFSTPVPDNSYRELKCTGQEISVDITDYTPLAELQVDDVITVNGFPATITSVEGSDGQFSGTCDMFVPLVGAKIKHYFRNITVTNSMQVSKGKVLSVRGDDVKFRVCGNDNSTTDDTDDDKFSISGDTLSLTNGSGVDTVIIDNKGDIIIVDTKGDTIKTGKKEITIVDKTGGTGDSNSSATDTYVVKGGEVIKTSGGGAGGSGGSGSDNGSGESVRLRFISPLDVTGGFDLPRYNQMITGGAYNRYQYDDNNYYIPWRSVESGKSAYIVAELVTDIDTLTREHILFTDSNSKKLTAQTTAGKNRKAQYIKVQLTGTSHEDVNRVTAQYITKDDEGNKVIKELAWIDVISYSNQPVDLVVAKANGNNPAVPVSELQRELNRIYSQSIISFRVSEIDLGKVRFDKDGDGKVDAGETGLISNYTRETRAFKKAVRRHPAYDNGSFYIVMAPEASTGRTNRLGLKGRWALKTQVGFVFNPEQMSSKEFVHTVAHECGHGIFRLWHTFCSNSSYPLVRGTTNNLMDYTISPDSTALFKYQWDYCHNPENMTGLFQDEEEGEYAPVTWISSIIQDIRCMRYWNKELLNMREYYKLRKEPIEDASVSLIGRNFTRIVAELQDKNSSYINVNIVNIDNNTVSVGKDKSKLEFSVYGKKLYGDSESAKWLYNYIISDKSEVDRDIEILLNKLDNKEDIGSIIKQLPKCFYEALSSERRVDYIEKLSENANENISTIVDLINTTPNHNAITFFEILGRTKLFYKLRSDGNVSFKNYTNFIRALTILFYQQDDIREKLINLPHTRLFVNETRTGNIGISITNSFTKKPDSLIVTGNVSLTYRNEQMESPYAAYNKTANTTTAFIGYKKSVGYCDLIGLELKSNYGHLKESVHNDVVPLPAFYFEWINYNMYRETELRSIDIAVTLISLAVGLGELQAISKVGKFVFSIKLIGVIKSSVDLVLLNKRIYRLIEKKTSAGSSFLSNWRKFTMIYDLAVFDIRNINKDRDLFTDLSLSWSSSKALLVNEIDPELFKDINTLILEIEKELNK
jgi:hypothetical protein